jgi:16S rRNA (adenine1518-N6/adenine1519-N6)-dimethyltransferase
VKEIPNPDSALGKLRSTLASRGLSPRKRFGQNFMVDSNFAAAIARDAQIDNSTLVIEVGPGTGCLTRALLDADPGSRVVAVEIDRGLAALLRETFASEIASQRLTLLEGDVLESKHTISQQVIDAVQSISAAENRPRRVLCSNLPYNIATPLLANAATGEDRLDIESAVVTIQLELAERFFAKPGSAEYSALSLFLALRAEGKILRRVGNEVFWPRPNVDSAVVQLHFKSWERSPLRREESGEFQSFLQKLFTHRRKTLRAVLKPQALPVMPGVEADARAEKLPPDVLLELFRKLKK